MEASPKAPEGEALGDNSLEEVPSGSPESGSANQAAQASAQVATAIALAGQPVVSDMTDDTMQVTSGSQASSQGNGGERIEKVWIDKTKAVAAQTKNDPFQQKQQISKVKAEYIQERFNKTIKTDDTVAK